MRKVILYIAMSLDGYIADKKGGVDWLVGDGSQPESTGTYLDFYETVDTIILGYATYNQIVTELSPNNWIYKDKKCYVITNKEFPSHDNIEFVKPDLIEFINKLKTDDGKDIWICGGANIAQTLMDADMIDTYRICVAPITLGYGIPLFKNTLRELKLSSAIAYNGFVELCYERR